MRKARRNPSSAVTSKPIRTLEHILTDPRAEIVGNKIIVHKGTSADVDGMRKRAEERMRALEGTGRKTSGKGFEKAVLDSTLSVSNRKLRRA